MYSRMMNSFKVVLYMLARFKVKKKSHCEYIFPKNLFLIFKDGNKISQL